MPMLQGEEVTMRILTFTMISLSILLYGCCKDGINTTVKKNLTTNLDKYHTAKIIVQDDDYKTSTKRTSDSSSEKMRMDLDGVLFGLLRKRYLNIIRGYRYN